MNKEEKTEILKDTDGTQLSLKGDKETDKIMEALERLTSEIRAKKSKLGRKPNERRGRKKESQNKDRITFYLDREIKDDFYNFCFERGKNPSELLRDFVVNYIKPCKRESKQ